MISFAQQDDGISNARERTYMAILRRRFRPGRGSPPRPAAGGRLAMRRGHDFRLFRRGAIGRAIATLLLMPSASAHTRALIFS